jgi:hypothetical protein
MRTHKIKLINGVITLILILQTSSVAVAGSPSEEAAFAIERAKAVLPDSLQMVDEAIATLSKGLSGLTAAEHELFLRFFDPGNTGDIDEDYLLQVIDNYRRLRGKLNDEMRFEYEPESKTCSPMGLFHTNFIEVHICPYILEEPSSQRIARDLVHEAAHMAWLVDDREYYYGDDYLPYQQMTPRGSPAAQIPLIGPIVREFARNDTLFNADTYCTFAAELVASR